MGILTITNSVYNNLTSKKTVLQGGLICLKKTQQISTLCHFESQDVPQFARHPGQTPVLSSASPRDRSGSLNRSALENPAPQLELMECEKKSQVIRSLDWLC